MRDPQKQALYDMEAREFRAVWFRVKQPMSYLRSLARSLCKMYDVPNVALVSRRLHGHAAEYDFESCRVVLNAKGDINGSSGNGRNVFTLAHELAHHIVWHRHGNRAQDHGPMFVLVYGQLLSSLRVLPLAGWRDACKRHSVKIARKANVH